jgi:ribosomal protein S8
MLPAPPHRLCAHLSNTSRAALALTSLPYSNASVGITSILLRHGLVSNMSLGGPASPDPAAFPTLPKPAQRLWINLKHRNGQPVLRRLELVSKASLRKFVDHDELGRILRGRRARNVHGVGTGEIVVVKVPTDSGAGRKGVATYMEGWEAYRAGLGGEVVCRAS